jgi:hypothetical protein
MTTLCDGNHPDLSTWGGSCFSWRLAYQHVDVLDKIMANLSNVILWPHRENIPPSSTSGTPTNLTVNQCISLYMDVYSQLKYWFSFYCVVSCFFTCLGLIYILQKKNTIEVLAISINWLITRNSTICFEVYQQ